MLLHQAPRALATGVGPLHPPSVVRAGVRARDELPLLRIRSPDVQAPLNVLGRRERVAASDSIELDLQDVDLRVAYFGTFDCSRAILARSNADFSDFTGACSGTPTCAGAPSGTPSSSEPT